MCFAGMLICNSLLSRFAAYGARRIWVPGFPHVSSRLRAALVEFDDRLPGLAKKRNVGEHIDDYVIGDGRAKDVQRGDLQVSTWDGTVFNWLRVELDIDAALEAAETLFEAVKLTVRGSA